jgi:hypothetical protein
MALDHGREIGERRRRERLSAALRENLKRRKSQQKGRAHVSADADRQSEGVQAANESPHAASRDGEA